MHPSKARLTSSSSSSGNRYTEVFRDRPGTRLCALGLAGLFAFSLSAFADTKAPVQSPPALSQTVVPPPAPVGPRRVSGTIVSFDGKTVTVRTISGDTVSAAVLPTAFILYNEPRTMADIHRGDFVGSAALTGADGKLHAQEVRIFPESLRGMGEGQYPMGDSATRIITNATVSEVTEVSPTSGTLKLEFHGTASPSSGACTGHAASEGTGCVGEAEIVVAPGVPILAYTVGASSALVAGVAVSALFEPGPDGAWTTSRLLVEHNGMKPV